MCLNVLIPIFTTHFDSIEPDLVVGLIHVYIYIYIYIHTHILNLAQAYVTYRGN